MRRKIIALAALFGFVTLAFTPVASADHAWGSYHWASTSNPLNIKLGDNVSASWDKYLSAASTDWSKSLVLDTSVVSGQTTGSRCAATNGRVEVCNAKYGSTGWLGIAEIYVSGGHITAGTVKLNDTYFSTATYNKGAWRQFVMCQEVGHIFGLDHQDETMNNTNLGSCMDYTNAPGTNGGLGNNLRPDLHDYNLLKTIYGHLDSTNTSLSSGAKSAAADTAETRVESDRTLGRSLREDGTGRGAHYVRDGENGEKIYTFVIWASDGH